MRKPRHEMTSVERLVDKYLRDYPPNGRPVSEINQQLHDILPGYRVTFSGCTFAGELFPDVRPCSLGFSVNPA